MSIKMTRRSIDVPRAPLPDPLRNGYYSRCNEAVDMSIV